MLKSQVREEIFKIMFRYPFVNEGEMAEQVSFSLEDLEGKSEENIQRIKNKVDAILADIETIDQKIEACCEGWSFNRIGKAEIAIMRIATYEIMFDEEIPNSVAINEAVELTKLYCDEDAKGFVNAVLGKIEKSVNAYKMKHSM